MDGFFAGQGGDTHVQYQHYESQGTYGLASYLSHFHITFGFIRRDSIQTLVLLESSRLQDKLEEKLENNSNGMRPACKNVHLGYL